MYLRHPALYLKDEKTFSSTWNQTHKNHFMINVYTLGTEAQALSGQINAVLRISYAPFYQARPGMSLPVVLFTHSKPEIIEARWGCLPEGAPSPLHLFPLEKVMTRPPLNRWIHTQRCLIPANCFFARNDETRDVMLIRLLNARTFLMAGLYCIQQSVSGIRTVHFLILTTESADVLHPITRTMPVLFTQQEMQAWLEGDHLIDLMELADGCGQHWFDYFKVDSAITTPGINKRTLLQPLGLSSTQIRERDQKLNAIDLTTERFNRKGSKR